MPAAPQNLPNQCSRLNTATTGVNFRLRLLKQWKIRIAYKQLGSKFPRRRTKPNTKRKTESYIFSGFGNFISRGWERKSSTTRFATGRFWLTWFTWKTLSVRTKSINENFFWLEITPTVLFVITIQPIFPSWALAPTYGTIVDSFISIH